MTIERNPLDTFAPDLTSIQMDAEQKTALLEGLATDGGSARILAAFITDGDGDIVPLGVDNIDEEGMWQGSVRVQVTYEINSLDQDDLRGLLIGLHEDLKVNGKARAVEARENEKMRVRKMVMDAEQAVRDAEAELERLRNYAKGAGVNA